MESRPELVHVFLNWSSFCPRCVNTGFAYGNLTEDKGLENTDARRSRKNATVCMGFLPVTDQHPVPLMQLEMVRELALEQGTSVHYLDND